MGTHIIHQQIGHYFVTFSCYKWLNLFEESGVYEYMPFWFEKLGANGCVLNGYVIMPNHIHMILYYKNEEKNLNKIISESKRFLAYEIVKRLTELKKSIILKVLEKGVQQNEKKKGKKHQVFRLSFDARELNCNEDIETVLDYIHHNPVSGKWNLIDDYCNFPYSSAAFYEDKKEGLVPIVDYRRESH